MALNIILTLNILLEDGFDVPEPEEMGLGENATWLAFTGIAALFLHSGSIFFGFPGLVLLTEASS